MLGHRARVVLGTVATATLLSGCWLQIGSDAGHSRFNALESTLNAGNVATLEESWSVDLLAVASEPVVNGGRAYLTTATPNSQVNVRAVNVATGATVWDRQLFQHSGDITAFSYTPATFVDDELWSGFVGIGEILGRPFGDFNSPVRLDPIDGALIDEEDHIGATAAVDAGTTVVQSWLDFSSGGHELLVARDTETLATLWTATLPGPDGGPPQGEIAVSGGVVFASRHTTVQAYSLEGCGSATCTPLWSTDLGAEAGMPVAVGGDDQVLVTTASGSLVSLDRTTGTTDWTASLGAAPTGLAVAGGQVFAAAGTTLSAFALGGCGSATCTATWTADLGAVASTSPTVAAGVVYVGTAGVVSAFPAPGCAGDGAGCALASVAVAGTPDHVVVDGGRLFVVHRSGSPAVAALTAFAPT